MGEVEYLIAGLLVAIIVLSTVARLVGIPYPIVLVVGGLILGFVPGMPEVELEPDVVLLIFLPPLLYSAAFFADLQAMRRDARGITLNAVGLVLFTMCAVALVAHELVDGMPWAAAFALRRGRLAHGSARGDDDHAAPQCPAPAGQRRRGREPGQRRHRAGRLQAGDRGGDRRDVLAHRGGPALLRRRGGRHRDRPRRGLRHRRDPQAHRRPAGRRSRVSLVSAYAAYIPAERVGASAVLAAVFCGLYLGFRAPEIASPQARIEALSVWESLGFLLNAILFVLIGLQLPTILDNLSGYSTATLLGYAAAVSGVVIVCPGGLDHDRGLRDPGHRPAAEPAGPARELADAPHRQLERHARLGVAGRGPRHPLHRGRCALPAARSHHLPDVRGHLRHPRPPGPHPARADQGARRGRRRWG